MAAMISFFHGKNDTYVTIRTENCHLGNKLQILNTYSLCSLLLVVGGVEHVYTCVGPLQKQHTPLNTELPLQPHLSLTFIFLEFQICIYYYSHRICIHY